MGDHISMALGEYPDLHVYKSMPYGTIEETLPYIARVNSNKINILLDFCFKYFLREQLKIDQSWMLLSENVKYYEMNSSIDAN